MNCHRDNIPSLCGGSVGARRNGHFAMKHLFQNKNLDFEPQNRLTFPVE